MAPIAGLIVVLSGLALILLDYRTRRGRRPAQILAAVAGILGLVAAVGHVYGSSPLYAIGRFIPMAANTALGFLVLSVGVLCARPADGLPAVALASDPGGALARRLLPATLVIPVLLGWLHVKGQAAGLYDFAGGIALLSAATILTVAVLIWKCAAHVNRSDLARHRAEENLQTLNEQLETRAIQRAEEWLRVTQARLGQVIASSPAVIYVLRAEGASYLPTWISENVLRVMGYAVEEALAPGWWIQRVHPDDLEGVVRPLLEQKGQVTCDYRFRHQDGSYRWILDEYRLLPDPRGNGTEIVGSWLDITERKLLEAQLRQAQKVEAVGQLAGGIAHDFNNLLTVIRTAAELLVANLEHDEARRADAAAIQDAAARAAALTRQLLAFSRRQILKPCAVDANAVVTELEPMMRRLVEENVAVVTRLARDLDRIKVDPSQLEQVLLNLVVNARDAMPQGGTLLIETANVVLDDEYPQSHLASPPGPYVVLTVTDTGCGMDAATRSRLFEPFFTTKPVGQGTGLGLATVYGIVKQSGGNIWVYSEVGRGTTFKISFPQYVGPDEELSAATAGSRPRADRPAGATILIVEDDTAVRSAVRRLLERQGYGVLEAPNGGDALLALAESPRAVDLVISDIVMPEMSGLQLRQKLRKLRPSLPVLLMSGYTEEAITRTGSSEPLPSLIEKPFTVDSILTKVQDLLGTGVPNA